MVRSAVTYAELHQVVPSNKCACSCIGRSDENVFSTNFILTTVLFFEKPNLHGKISTSKIGYQGKCAWYFINAPPGAVKSLDPPNLDVASSLRGNFDCIHLFITKKKALHDKFPKLKEHLHENGMLWISWPKARQKDTDLTLKVVIKIGYDYGLVESKTLSINATWSALKFTHPKKGKIYKNSYGKLKGVASRA